MPGQKAFIKEGGTSIQYYTPEQEDLINQVYDKVSFDSSIPRSERMQTILEMINNPEKYNFFERKSLMQERPTSKSIDQIIQESNFIESLAPADKTNVEANYTIGGSTIENLLKNRRIHERKPLPSTRII
tara:strand:- start:12337 stop:12726 length:390 start_codon:yes stop_codon:yes gene_type:complete